MTRKVVNWVWEDEDAQKVFAEWLPFPNEDEAVQFVNRIESFLEISPTLEIIDVGCGNGRYTVELAKRGYHVVAIDVATSFLADAKGLAKQAGVTVEFRLQRGSELKEIEAFDMALALSHNIGFMNRKEVVRHFRAICQSLRPGGILLFTFAGPRHIPSRELGSSKPVKSWGEKEGRFILSEKTYHDGYRNEYCIVIDTNTQEIVEYHEHQRTKGLEEIVGHLKQAGFLSVQAYNGFDQEPATDENFFVFVCKKQGSSNKANSADAKSRAAD